MSQHDSYIAAGYSSNQLPSTIDENASRLANDSKILARMLELRNMVAVPTIATKKRIAERLTHVLESDVINENGTPVLNHIVQSAAELNKMQGNYAKTDIGQAQTIINIIVPDKETKNLLSNVVDNTKVIETGYNVLPETLPEAPE
jgi:phage terminase small subunit